MKRVVSFAAALALSVALTLAARADFETETDYSLLMTQAAAAGDAEAGAKAALSRNEKIDALGLPERKYAYTDLVLLAKVIHIEAGSSWLPDTWRLCVGEVLLNRVASPEFPDTLEECIHQPGQYSGTDGAYFESLVPYLHCAQAAARLLGGERVLEDPSVVFQSGGPQGSGVCLELEDDCYGATYFCYSNYPERYPE